jgi:hypothetical protein
LRSVDGAGAAPPDRLRHHWDHLRKS